MVGSRAQKKWDLGAKRPQSADGAAIDPVAYFAQATVGQFSCLWYVFAAVGNKNALFCPLKLSV
jgi:hypothetical protein